MRKTIKLRFFLYIMVFMYSSAQFSTIQQAIHLSPTLTLENNLLPEKPALNQIVSLSHEYAVLLANGSRNYYQAFKIWLEISKIRNAFANEVALYGAKKILQDSVNILLDDNCKYILPENIFYEFAKAKNLNEQYIAYQYAVKYFKIEEFSISYKICLYLCFSQYQFIQNRLLEFFEHFNTEKYYCKYVHLVQTLAVQKNPIAIRLLSGMVYNRVFLYKIMNDRGISIMGDLLRINDHGPIYYIITQCINNYKQVKNIEELSKFVQMLIATKEKNFRKLAFMIAGDLYMQNHIIESITILIQLYSYNQSSEVYNLITQIITDSIYEKKYSQVISILEKLFLHEKNMQRLIELSQQIIKTFDKHKQHYYSLKVLQLCIQYSKKELNYKDILENTVENLRKNRDSMENMQILLELTKKNTSNALIQLIFYTENALLFSTNNKRYIKGKWVKVQLDRERKKTIRSYLRLSQWFELAKLKNPRIQQFVFEYALWLKKIPTNTTQSKELLLMLVANRYVPACNYMGEKLRKINTNIAKIKRALLLSVFSGITEAYNLYFTIMKIDILTSNTTAKGVENFGVIKNQWILLIKKLIKIKQHTEIRILFSVMRSIKPKKSINVLMYDFVRLLLEYPFFEKESFIAYANYLYDEGYSADAMIVWIMLFQSAYAKENIQFQKQCYNAIRSFLLLQKDTRGQTLICKYA